MNMKVLRCLLFSYAGINHRQLRGMAYSLNRAVPEDPTVNQPDLGPHLLGLGGPVCLPSALYGALLCRAASVGVIFLGLA